MSLTISFRPVKPEDEPFLCRVYASTREEELAMVPWSDDQKDAFIRMQFNAQRQDYEQRFSNASFETIHCEDKAVGRLYLDRRESEIRVIDIALLPEYRRRGIGGTIMRGILDEARAAGTPVRIHVAQNNPAKPLYNRLGFQKIDDVGIYDLMEWRPENESHDARLENEK